VWVRFADTGHGLSPEVREHLFEPFHTTKSEGLGLGLFISQGIVQQHGGRIEARAGKEVGTVFSVWLPRPQESDRSPGAPLRPVLVS
jgi:polar amino acid transport system substrate-binding protein